MAGTFIVKVKLKDHSEWQFLNPNGYLHHRRRHAGFGSKKSATKVAQKIVRQFPRTIEDAKVVRFWQ